MSTNKVVCQLCAEFIPPNPAYWTEPSADCRWAVRTPSQMTSHRWSPLGCILVGC